MFKRGIKLSRGPLLGSPRIFRSTPISRTSPRTGTVVTNQYLTCESLRREVCHDDPFSDFPYARYLIRTWHYQISRSHKPRTFLTLMTLAQVKGLSSLWLMTLAQSRDFSINFYISQSNRLVITEENITSKEYIKTLPNTEIIGARTALT